MMQVSEHKTGWRDKGRWVGLRYALASPTGRASPVRPQPLPLPPPASVLMLGSPAFAGWPGWVVPLTVSGWALPPGPPPTLLLTYR